MARLELNKHLPPKLSTICNELSYFYGENLSYSNYKTPETTRPVSLAPPSTRFPELKKIKEFGSDYKPSKENLRLKKHRVSMDPSPKQLKSDYYEKALEKYFDLSQHYEKMNDEVFDNLTNES